MSVRCAERYPTTHIVESKFDSSLSHPKCSLMGCQRFFSYYRDVACTIYPVISDTQVFEATLNGLLQNRNLSGGVYVPTDASNDRPFGVSLSWLALLFAVLASGSQSSDRPPKERELTSQVYSRLEPSSWWSWKY
jgi:hypothetical protein